MMSATVRREMDLPPLPPEEAPDTASEEAERARIFAREAALTAGPLLAAGPEEVMVCGVIGLRGRAVR